MVDLIIQFVRWLKKTLSGFLTWGWGLVIGLFGYLSDLGSKIGDFFDDITPFIEQMLSIVDWSGASGLQGTDPVGILDFFFFAFGIDIFGRFAITFLGLILVCGASLFFLIMVGFGVAVSQYLFKFVLRVKGLFFTS